MLLYISGQYLPGYIGSGLEVSEKIVRKGKYELVEQVNMYILMYQQIPEYEELGNLLNLSLLGITSGAPMF